MKMNKNRLFITCDAEVKSQEIRAVTEGIISVLRIAEMDTKIEVKDFGVWNVGNQPYENIGWYIRRGYNPARDQVDASVVLTECLNEPWQKIIPHYEVMVLSYDLYVGNTNFVFGVSQQGFGTVFSTFRFRCGNVENLKTITIHELGHVFGLVDKSRRDLDYRLGPHCVNNRCVMRQAVNITELSLITKERVRYGTIFCPRCTEDLKKIFSK